MTAFRKATFFTLLIGISCTAAVAALRLPRASASINALADGRYRLIDDVLGEKRIGLGTNEKILVDRKQDAVLYSKGWHGGIADSELGGGMELHRSSFDGGRDSLVAQDVREAFLGSDGKAAFYVDANATLLVAAEGQAAKKIADKVLRPALSPDGTHVVYQRLPPDWKPGEAYDRALGLAILDLATGAIRPLTDHWEDFNPLWTPDGKKIIFFSANAQGMAAHFVIDADGGARTQLTNMGASETGPDTIPVPSETPVWSSDGKYLAYESDRQIWVNGFVPGYGKIVSARAVSYGKHPEWAADDKSLSVIVGSQPDTVGRAVMVNLNGSIIR